jgi:hypothetical protein
MVSKLAKRTLRSILQRTNFGYRFLLKREHGIRGPHGYPDAPWVNSVLKTEDEIRSSVAQVRRLGLPLVNPAAKNWDSLAALSLLLRTTTAKSTIFDAGGELYSMILPWLSLYGYTHLIAGNLVFAKKMRRGPIVYEYADITETNYPDNMFDAVVCLSVIEHGVDLKAYFREMSRVIRPGGNLITSTDYYDAAIDTSGRIAYGVPIHIFTEEEIASALDLARSYGFTLMSPLDLTAGEKVVRWSEYDLAYSFVVFSLQRCG